VGQDATPFIKLRGRRFSLLNAQGVITVERALPQAIQVSNGDLAEPLELIKGESMEAIHRDLSHTRKTIRKYRGLAEKHGFLEVDKPLPSVTEIAKVLGPVKRPKQCTSTVEPYKEVVKEYLNRGVAKTVIWRKLREDHGYTGSYSSVKRYCRRLEPHPIHKDTVGWRQPQASRHRSTLAM